MSSINLTSPPTHSQCTIQQLIPRLIGLLRILTHPYATILIIPLLIYNIFIYIYLGILEQGIDFYRGFGLQYSLFYSAVAVGYWSIWIQSQQLTNSSIIITNELLNADSFTNPPCDCPSLLWCLKHSTHFRLIESNLKYLYLYTNHVSSLFKSSAIIGPILLALGLLWAHKNFMGVKR